MTALLSLRPNINSIHMARYVVYLGHIKESLKVSLIGKGSMCTSNPTLVDILIEGSQFIQRILFPSLIEDEHQASNSLQQWRSRQSRPARRS